MSVLIEAVVILVIAAVGTWVLDRQLAREERERQRREWLASRQAQQIARAFAEMQRQISEALMPAMQRAAESLARAMGNGGKR